MIKVHMAGDSTMSVKSARELPETGWGMPFAAFFDDEVAVTNHAVNGRSTSTFREEGRWEKILSSLRTDDVVIIQFGHNDEVPEKVGRYTTPEQYKFNLSRFIEETRRKRGEPMLLSPVVRRTFEDNGTLQDTHPYAVLVREVANESGVFFVDMERLTRMLVEGMGDEASKALYLHLAPGAYPNYPKGRTDNTHLSPLGAREFAELFVGELKQRGHRLAAHIDARNR